MAKFYRNVIIGTGIMFMAIIMLGFGLSSPSTAPTQGLKMGSGTVKSVQLTAQGAYPDDMSLVESVKSWFGVDINAERAAKHRSAELRKLKLRAKGHKTYNTRTKGVLYNGS
ncbi:hypothetical protein C8N43_3349 [Litoreibacter ponti]|uniref:Uncharacterized protein n=1 Tax=Litoreibacter ponti TaxID=1510457 RepID=A0A2T6BEP9_9RHOB|nr:hypothetical protein [Litoreibacter ponti]PTX54533.1 hypothetical protein C8N43_3349 [Litoreibacter ponti]